MTRLQTSLLCILLLAGACGGGDDTADAPDDAGDAEPSAAPDSLDVALCEEILGEEQFAPLGGLESTDHQQTGGDARPTVLCDYAVNDGGGIIIEISSDVSGVQRSVFDDFVSEGSLSPTDVFGVDAALRETGTIEAWPLPTVSLTVTGITLLDEAEEAALLESVARSAIDRIQQALG